MTAFTGDSTVTVFITITTIYNMSKFLKTLNKFLIEAPITDLEVMGDISDDGYDKGSVKFLNNPKFEEQIKSSWAKSKNNFDIKFLAHPDWKDLLEYGIASDQEIEDKLDIEDYKANPNAITVFFTNNKGAELKPMTPWIAAHRFGHTVRAGVGRDPKLKKLINDLEETFIKIVNIYLKGYKQFRSNVRNVNQFILFKPLSQEITRQLVNNMGTMRSARKGMIDRPFEFFYELFAQHLTSGKVKFNRNPKPLDIQDNEYDFDLPSYMEPELDTAESLFNNQLQQVLNYSVGKSFIM